MIRDAAFAALFAVVPALAAGATAAARPAAAPAAPVARAGQSEAGVVSLSLVEALAAVKRPELSGLFSFIAEQDAPFAFADFVARDKKSLSRYLDKLDEDRKAANGTTEWDHAVCAALVNLYASPLAGTFGKPEEKKLSKINQCVLSTVVPLSEIVARRKP